MIIQILSNLCDEGYLEKKEGVLISPFFAGANVAFRREVFERIGHYDANCSTGEDQDICIRAANTEWELYYQPKALVGHKNRTTLKGLIKQWFRYGLHHPYIFKKHSPKSLALYRKRRKVKKGILYECILYKERLPFQILIFASSFLLLNMFLTLAILTILFGFNILAIVFGSITLLVGIYYFMPDIEIKHFWRSIKFIFLRYVVNMALLIAGLLGGAKLKMIYISGTLDYKLKPDNNKR